jgi:hypothetical protein
VSTDLALGADHLADMERAGALGPVGLDLTMRSDMTYEQYVAIGRLLGRATAAIRWAVGDYLAFGEDRFGELAAQASEELGLSPEGRMELLRVSRSIPRHRRRARLSWSHHRAVASRHITPSERDALLDRAEQEGLTANDLTEAVREVRDKLLLPRKDLGPTSEDCDVVLDSAVDGFHEAVVHCYGKDAIATFKFEAVIQSGPGAELRIERGNASSPARPWDLAVAEVARGHE